MAQSFREYEEKTGNILHTFLSKDESHYIQRIEAPLICSISSFQKRHPESSVTNFLAPDFFRCIPLEDALCVYDSFPASVGNYIEFVLVLKGNLYCIVNGKRILFTAGNGYLLGQNILHNSEYRTDFIVLTLQFPLEFFRTIQERRGQLFFSKERSAPTDPYWTYLENRVGSSGTDSSEFLVFHPLISGRRQKETLHAALEKLVLTLLTPGSGATFSIYECLFRFFDVLSDESLYKTSLVQVSDDTESLLFARITTILEEKRGRISNKALSERLSYSGSYISHVVKKYTNKSLFDYSMSITMRYAAEQLERTDRNVNEIMEELSFTNRSHFYKIFKEHYDMTPAEYRKQRMQSEDKSNAPKPQPENEKMPH